MSEILILASKSAARRAILAGAGVAHEIDAADIDETALKTPGADPSALAEALAREKALAVSARRPGRWVLGGDQTLMFDGSLISKARSLDEARARLSAMRGRPHSLFSGAALARDGRVAWSGVDEARMQVRDFSDAFLDHYLAVEGEALLSCVGAYRLEGPGAQLFARIDGDYFTVLGLPLWPVLEALRRSGVLKA